MRRLQPAQRGCPNRGGASRPLARSGHTAALAPLRATRMVDHDRRQPPELAPVDLDCPDAGIGQLDRTWGSRRIVARAWSSAVCTVGRHRQRARRTPISPGPLPDAFVCCLSKPPVSPHNCWKANLVFPARKWRFAGVSPSRVSQIYRLPCRRSRVRIPSAAFMKGLHLQDFFVCAVGLCVCVGSELTPDSQRADRRPFQGKRPVCRPILVRPNRSPSAGLQNVRCSACCGPLARLLLQPDNPEDSARRRDTSGRGPLGLVRFQSGTAKSTSPRCATPASHGPQSRELSPQEGVRGAVPSRGACAAAVTRGQLKVSLSIGKDASARTWAGLRVVIAFRLALRAHGHFDSPTGAAACS